MYIHVGIVSGNNKEKFAISFSPMEYSTATMKFKVHVHTQTLIHVHVHVFELSTIKLLIFILSFSLQLDVVQFNFQPLLCTVTGNAVPGLAL